MLDDQLFHPSHRRTLLVTTFYVRDRLNKRVNIKMLDSYCIQKQGEFEFVINFHAFFCSFCLLIRYKCIHLNDFLLYLSVFLSCFVCLNCGHTFEFKGF